MNIRHECHADVNPNGALIPKHSDECYVEHRSKKSSKRVISKVIVVILGDKAHTLDLAAGLSNIGGQGMFETKLRPQQML